MHGLLVLARCFLYSTPISFPASKLKKSVIKQRLDAIAISAIVPAIAQVKINGRSTAQRHQV
ncbi:hypothetical protein QUB37_07605 [Microcoleus sp. AT3-A2]|uniref:hypothetical protein n=1 Tax=Microcoleus sp. AT3-A2 TaxID=2818610 RepID=UPI002FD0352E